LELTEEMDEIVPKKRRSIRLRGFDYSQAGNYFITTCTSGRKRILGTVRDHKVILSPAGETVRAAWFDLPRRFPSMEPRELVVMPNHVHAILGLTHPIRAAARGAASSAPTAGKAAFAYPALGEVIRAFKSLSAIEVNSLLGRPAQPVWQRNYYERIIRSDREYSQARRYTLENPIHWDQDPENV
jgi:putative transposase